MLALYKENEGLKTKLEKAYRDVQELENENFNLKDELSAQEATIGKLDLVIQELESHP